MNSTDTRSSMVTDGATYVLLAIFTALTASMESDGAAKWLDPKTLFWIQTACAALSAGLLAFKMFRSTSFAHHQQVKEAENGHGQAGQIETVTTITPVAPIVSSQVTSTPPSVTVPPVQP